MARVFIVDDNVFDGKLLSKVVTPFEYLEPVCFLTFREAMEELHKGVPAAVLLDYHMDEINGVEALIELKKVNPELPILVISGQKNVNVVVEAYDHGADHYVVKGNADTNEKLSSYLSHINEKAKEKEAIDKISERLSNRENYYEIIGESAAILQVLRLIEKVKNTDMLTMVTGDSGTGKELVARAIHFNSERRKRPFVPVNISAIPDDLIEAELFGHEKGAFTGAGGRRTGYIEEAHRGTLFLDEIGEINLEVQKKLLRVLQDKKISRLGSNKEVEVDVRIVAATNKNLAQMVKDRTFREDLYYRLQGFLIHLPPLRERGNDIELLSKSFLRELCAKQKIQPKVFSEAAMKKINEHHWPGNVRELKASIERCILMADFDEIQSEDVVFSQPIFD